MSSPEVVEEGEDESPPEATDEDVEAELDGGREAPDDDEVEMVSTDVGESGVDPEGFFDDVDAEVSGGDEVVDGMFDDVEGSSGSRDDGEETPEAKPTRDSGLAADINNGAARAAVIGLDDEWETDSGSTRTKEGLRDEFHETFEAFRLGHYGSEVVEEHLLVEAEDINPVWGLVGAMLICAAVVVYKRPDGDQVVESTKMRFGQIDLSTIKPGED